LLKGTGVEGAPELHGGRDQTVRFIDSEHLKRPTAAASYGRRGYVPPTRPDRPSERAEPSRALPLKRLAGLPP
jgi:hypothetical protein